MLLTPEQIQIEALSLPPHKREELAGRLLESLGSEPSVETEWLILARHRLDEIRARTARTVEGKAVIKQARE